MMNSDGTSAQRMTNNPAIDSNPIFSSDGKEIFFLSNREGYTQMYSMNLSNMQVTKVATKDYNDISSLQLVGNSKCNDLVVILQALSIFVAA